MKSEAIYEQLRLLFSGKRSVDAFSAETDLAKIVEPLLQDIVSPMKLMTQSKMPPVEYRPDWEVKMSQYRSAFFELIVGNVSPFRVATLRELASSLSSILPSAWFHLVLIGRGIDRKESSSLVTLKNELLQTHIRVTFIDHEALIHLHEFLVRPTRHEEKNRRLKREFLITLFDSPLLEGHTPLIEEAYRKAHERLREKKGKTELARSADRLSFETPFQASFELSDETLHANMARLEKLEAMLQRALEEVRSLRKQFIREPKK
jgi:hypothetical protein